jgi:hypothetical protein
MATSIYIERPFRRRPELLEKIDWIRHRVTTNEYHIQWHRYPECPDEEIDYDLDIESIGVTITLWCDDAERITTEFWFQQ